MKKNPLATNKEIPCLSGRRKIWTNKESKVKENKDKGQITNSTLNITANHPFFLFLMRCIKNGWWWGLSVVF